MKKPTVKQMTNLATDADLKFDGGDDNRLFLDADQIVVFANLMTKSQYTNMEQDINSFEIKGDGYTVGCWNDSSGYSYWKKQGEADDSNYIQITAYITDAKKVNASALKADMVSAFNRMVKYNNIEEYYAKREVNE